MCSYELRRRFPHLVLLAELNFKGNHESVGGNPAAARILRPGNLRCKLKKKPGPVKIPSVFYSHAAILNVPFGMIHSPHTGVIRNCALWCQLSEKTDPGISGYSRYAIGNGHEIAPSDERKRGQFFFKVELRCFSQMFN